MSGWRGSKTNLHYESKIKNHLIYDTIPDPEILFW